MKMFIQKWNRYVSLNCIPFSTKGKPLSMSIEQKKKEDKPEPIYYYSTIAPILYHSYFIIPVYILYCPHTPYSHYR